MEKKLLPLMLIFHLVFGLIYGAWYDTPTYDEPANMAASFDYVYRGDFRIYPDNPPLVKMLAGLALFPIKNKIKFPDHLEVYQDPQRFDLYAFGREFVFGQQALIVRQLIFLARLPNIAISIGLGILLYFFARNLFGAKAGLFALFFYSLDPNIRGHGHILAFDIPLTFIILLVLFITFRILKRSNIKYLISNKQRNNHNVTSHDSRSIILYSCFLILLFSLGFLVKFTFIFFAAIYFLAVPFVGRRQNISWKILVTYLLSLVTISFIVVWLFAFLTGYNRRTLDYDQVPNIASGNRELKNDLKWRLFKALPVPYYYKTGIMIMYLHDLVSQPAYLFGQVRAKNDWFFYFPISYLLKVPIPTLIVILFSLLVVVKDVLSGKKLLVRRYFPFVIGACFMLFMMVFSHINNVFRYLFPSHVLFILGSSQIVRLIESAKRKTQSEKLQLKAKNLNKIELFYPQPTTHNPQLVLLFLILTTCYLLLTSFFSFPYDLSYTNEFTGIPARGYKYLSDSEIDWGQDLGRLAIWLKEKGFDKEVITLSYLGTSDPAYYGIKYKPLTFENLQALDNRSLKGIVAISVGNLTLGDWQWTSRDDYKIGLLKAPLDNLRSRTPDAVIGKSIFVYRY